MRSAARFIVGIAGTLLIVPALFADDTAKPKTNLQKDEPAASVASTATSEATDNSGTLPIPFSTTAQSDWEPNRQGGCARRTNRKAPTPKLNGSSAIPSGERCLHHPAIAWAIYMVEALP